MSNPSIRKWKTKKPQHPEAPKEGDELLYVDLNRDRS
jgi:outer membrane PBP1 activator LpoA protein